MYTWQDFQKECGASDSGINAALRHLVQVYKSSEAYNVAVDADAYDRQQNTTISRFIRKLYTANGMERPDTTVSNSRLCSSLFRRLNTQRATYSLGNGVIFEADGVKEKLGSSFDTRIYHAAYNALKHGVCYLFWNIDHVHVFPATEFAPLWDEDTGALMAGLRFWQVSSDKPVQAVFYEADGYTRYKANSGIANFEIVEEKRAYKITTAKAPADAEPMIVGEENYNGLPIVPLYGSRLKQSTLIGMKSQIDAYDLVRSGFCNDQQDCASVYWIIGGAGGMDSSDLAKFRDRLKMLHIATVEDQDNVSVTPYTQEIPHESRKAFLDMIRAGIYEDFGALDVHAIAAGSTNDHLEAAYQPMDENADDLEYELIECIQALLRLQGIEDTPRFKRNRISNERERTEMLMMAANYLDDESMLELLPFVTPEMVNTISERKLVNESMRMMAQPMEGTDNGIQ